ncbi:hypothetical protein, partial [Marinomonas sp. BSi20584]|uniref:hypothetical protein n=1 Tax=Marinomonas sp. BSi20584 TaxID=1594462 RepID=UPI001E52C2C3
KKTQLCRSKNPKTEILPTLQPQAFPDVNLTFASTNDHAAFTAAIYSEGKKRNLSSNSIPQNQRV